MERFIFLDYVTSFPEALFRILAWVQAGDIRYEETVSLGLGKQLVQLR
jgi:NADPH-dependent curcumin reductase CurA